MKPKECMAIPRQKPNELDPVERVRHFKEVTFGYDEETAIRESFLIFHYVQWIF